MLKTVLIVLLQNAGYRALTGNSTWIQRTVIELKQKNTKSWYKDLIFKLKGGIQLAFLLDILIDVCLVAAKKILVCIRFL